MLVLHQKHLTEELLSPKEKNQNLIQRDRRKEKRGRDPEIRVVRGATHLGQGFLETSTEGTDCI